MNKTRINRSVLRSIEVCILFAAFFLPGYLAQSGGVDGTMFNSVSFNIIYIASSLPQILLLLYIVLLEGRAWPPFPYLEQFGIKPLKWTDIPKALLIYGGMYGVLIIVVIAGLLLNAGGAALLENRISWGLSSFTVLPLVVVSMTLTGYREELFFRSYLMTRLKSLGFPGWAQALLGSVLFALGHMYQGPLAFAGTFCIGLFLSFMFLRMRNLHALAIAHGLYNITTIVLTSVLPAFPGVG